MSTPETATIPLSSVSINSPAGASTLHSLDAKSSEEWDNYVLSHRDGSPFHQIGWKNAIEKTFGFRPFYIFARQNGRFSGAAPVFLISNWLTGRCLISNPFAVYGGVLADDDHIEAHLVRELERLAEQCQARYLELRTRRAPLLAGFHANARHSTFTLPLVNDAALLYNGLPKDIRYMIRKAEKAGLKVRHGLEQLECFYRLMSVNLRRLGTPAFPRAWFENLLQQFPGQASISVVYEGETAIAAGLSLVFREWMQPYYIGSLDSAKKVGGNNFLWWQLMKLAAEKGCTTFDFGRSKNESGNFDFKKKWNPTIESLQYQVRLFQGQDVPNFSPANPKFQMATNLWKHIPLGLTRMLGPRVIRWFP